MINRYIPYGYYVQDAQIRINESEASVIRTVFHDYISGASLKDLASQLTMAGTEFLPGRSDWDVNRVYRLLCNEKYAGNDEFSPIVYGCSGNTVWEKPISKRSRSNHDNHRRRCADPLRNLRCPGEATSRSKRKVPSKICLLESGL